MNMLVAGEEQIFDMEWQTRLKVSIIATGNALLDDEIMALSRKGDMVELLRWTKEHYFRS